MRPGWTVGGSTVGGVPYGLLTGLLVFAVLVGLTLLAPRRPRWFVGLGFRVAAAYNELPFVFIALIGATAVVPLLVGGPDGVGEWLAFVLAIAIILGLAVIAGHGFRARPAVMRALDEGLGPGWRDHVDPALLAGLRTRTPLLRILFMPFVFRPPGVRRVRDVSYAGAGRANRLDIVHHRSRPQRAPVLVHLHGGGYHGGRKNVEARALLFHLARRGWVTVSANYRLRPGAGFPEHLDDAKCLIAWLREHGHRYGADPDTLFLCGSSAGAHLATIAALTQNDLLYQPGVEDADTSVTAVVCLSGWYGGYYELGDATSEVGVLGHGAVDAPPFFIAHGTADTLAHIETARRFVDHLRAGSANPVVFAELPRGQHAFDLFRSQRFEAVVDGIEAFAARVRDGTVGWSGSGPVRPNQSRPG